MRRSTSIPALWLAAACLCLAGASACPAAQASAPAAEQPETIDRIVARVEDDIILLSEVRELAAYQQLVDGRAQSEDKLIASLIEQWVVRGEAQQANFPATPTSDVDAEAARIQSTFPSAQVYRERLAAVGLTPQGLRRIVEQQFYLERYLDYKFRPSVQIEDSAIAKYYQDELTPELHARGQAPPLLDDVRERIREVLVQRGINESADRWFEETKSRLQVEISTPPTVEGSR